MKILKIKKTIQYNLIFSFLIISATVGAVYYFNLSNKELEEEQNKIVTDVSRIKAKTSELETKTLENKKYAEIWLRIDERKKLALAIKIDEINQLVANLAGKYSINNHTLKVNLPESFPNEIFKNDTAPLSYSSGELTYTAYQDIKAIQFADEFIKSLHGYPIVTNFKFSKDKEYENQDLFDISTNKNLGVINAKIIFSWYIYSPNKPNSNK